MSTRKKARLSANARQFAEIDYMSKLSTDHQAWLKSMLQKMSCGEKDSAFDEITQSWVYARNNKANKDLWNRFSRASAPSDCEDQAAFLEEQMHANASSLRATRKQKLTGADYCGQQGFSEDFLIKLIDADRTE